MVSMVHRHHGFFGLVFLFAALSGIAYSQNPTTCAVSAVPPLVHSEGLAERVGDILLQCTGTPGTAATASLSVMLPVTITNRIDANSFSTDASLTIDTGSGPVASGVSGRVTNQSISFSGFHFTVPASGKVSVRLTDLRADVNQLGLVPQSPIQAFLSSTLPLSNNPVIVAFAQQGLLATISGSGVRCTGSPLPASVSLTNLFAAGTAEETTRVTEGFEQAFQPKDPTSDTGTRILLTYTNFPAGASIYVPDAVAGSDSTLPTSGGGLGPAAAVGEYTPGSGALLLVRVLNTDANGVGGTLTALPAPNSSGVLVLDGAHSVSLTNGAGYAVFEVVDANPALRETAQIPSFFGIPANTPATVANLAVQIAPLSTVTSASTTAPIPRFAPVTPPSDCNALGDCSASYFPLLQVSSPPLQATAVAGGRRVAEGWVTVRNMRGGVLEWSASITYANGAGWLVLDHYFGFGNGAIGVFADPSALAPGAYTATLLVDAGPMAGSQSVPVTLTVTAAQPAMTVTSVTNAADFHPGPVAPGSLAAVFGTNLAGQNVSVTFGGLAASLLYTGAAQINLRIPPGLTGPSSQMVVTVDGRSATFPVPLTPIAPALFTPGVLNQDNTVNGPANPAPAGSVLQIFGTGMPDAGGVVMVNIHDRRNLIPQYAGAAPGLPGMQQVNVAVPADLPAMSAHVTVCIGGVCSQPVTVVIGGK